ncbi:hypothetical protein EVAR_38362_1 [Eumeta japonica]|uniref:Uncharacterized protein n=1 Tax=Eumeta variegata TaxID=151549 RepID=A0A4C1XYW7_EUMVA|nr:hypothetical protein EVAR_38362_1 [Eumeta japonica]
MTIVSDKKKKQPSPETASTNGGGVYARRYAPAPPVIKQLAKLRHVSIERVRCDTSPGGSRQSGSMGPQSAPRYQICISTRWRLDLTNVFISDTRAVFVKSTNHGAGRLESRDEKHLKIDQQHPPTFPQAQQTLLWF